MARISGLIDYTAKKFRKMILPEPHYNFSLILPENLVYDVALDQSSSCTGIAIFSTDNQLKILLELARDTGNKETFYRDVKQVLANIVKGRVVRLVICEDPPPVKGKMYSSRVLLELRGRVESWMEIIPEFNSAKFCSIFPQSWKTLVMDKSKGKGRSSVKKCIAEDVTDIFECFRIYYNNAFNKDYDGFDAVGILEGYRRYAFSPEGIPLICGTQEKRHTSFVWYRYIPVEFIKDKQKLNEVFGNCITQVKPEFKLYNTRYNKHQNIRMASSNTEHCIYTLLSDKEFDVLKWKYDLEKKDDYVLLMYVMNEARNTSGIINLLKAIFPMNEEVYEL